MQPIYFVETERKTVRFPNADRWAFRPHGRLEPLLRRLFAWLVRKGHFTNCFDEKQAFTRHVVEPDSVVEALFRQREEVAQYVSRRATTVLMGPEDYAQMMRRPEIHQYLSFPAEARDERGVLGLTIKIVPWMRGVLVVP